MKKQILILLLMLCLIVPVISATSIYYKQNDTIDLKIQCINNGTYCSPSAFCNLTIQFPDGSLLVNNKQMTNQISFYNYTILNSAMLGTYKCSATCCDAGYCGTNSAQDCDYIITPSGTELSVGQSILYTIGLILAVIIFCFSLYTAIVIPFRNGRDEHGHIISVNNLKWVKVGFIAITYVILLFIVGLADGIFRNFLSVIGVNMFFDWLYWILLSLMFPLFVVGIVLIFVIYIYDYVAKKKLKRRYFR